MYCLAIKAQEEDCALRSLCLAARQKEKMQEILRACGWRERQKWLLLCRFYILSNNKNFMIFCLHFL